MAIYRVCEHGGNIYTVKNEVCKAHQIVSIHTLFGEKCGYRDILVCMAHFSIYSVECVNIVAIHIECEQGGNIECANMVAI